MAPNPMLTIPPYEYVFDDGREIGRCRVRTRVIATLVAPSGRLLACDPLTSLELPPFLQLVKPGSYPVLITTLECPDGRSSGDSLFAT